jgi:hypothetical protein
VEVGAGCAGDALRGRCAQLAWEYTRVAGVTFVVVQRWAVLNTAEPDRRPRQNASPRTAQTLLCCAPASLARGAASQTGVAAGIRVISAGALLHTHIGCSVEVCPSSEACDAVGCIVAG